MNSATVLTAGLLADAEGIAHGFFTREGGVSSGDYTSLNVGLGSGDAADNVLENRHRIAHYLGAVWQGEPAADVVTAYQVHSARAVIVDQPFASDARPEADALVTAIPGMAIGVLTADCTPVLLADPAAKVVAAAHAGWRGAVGGILASAVEAMEQLGASRQRIRAAIGPTIHQQNYEVGPEFKRQFLDAAPGNARFFALPPGGQREHFDLPGYCRLRLEDLAIGEIEDLELCTYKNESLFFSYRRKSHRNEADYGRQISAIVVT